jgi:hypothetical protein
MKLRLVFHILFKGKARKLALNFSLGFKVLPYSSTGVVLPFFLSFCLPFFVSVDEVDL